MVCDLDLDLDLDLVNPGFNALWHNCLETVVPIILVAARQRCILSINQGTHYLGLAEIP